MTTVRLLIPAALAIVVSSVACASRSKHYHFPTKGGAERGYDARVPNELDASADTESSRQP